MPRIADGRREHPAYRKWVGMRQRCNDPNSKSYPRYGGRGITVAPEWDDFWAFAEHVGYPPEDGQRWTLDRIDNDGNYEPGNVRWALDSEQNKNRRRIDQSSRRRETCSQGHSDFRVSSSGRYCYPCALAGQRARRRAKREAVSA